MEKRALAPLVLGGAGVALAVAIAVLLVKVRAGAPAPVVSPAETSRAARARQVPSSPPAASAPSRPAVRPPVGEPESDSGSAQAGVGAIAPLGEGKAALATRMTEANRLYDRGDYEAANQVADEVLKEEPKNVKMLRIATSSACILGEPQKARVYFDQLPERDQEQIARRCRRYGVEF